MSQLDLFATPDEPTEASERVTTEPSRRPITFEEARMLSGDDVVRILCGESREVALEQARRRLAEPPQTTATEEHTRPPSSCDLQPYVNMTDEVISFRTDWCLIMCCPHDAVWVRPDEMHGDLVDVQTARRMLAGEPPSGRLAVALTTAEGK